MPPPNPCAIKSDEEVQGLPSMACAGKASLALQAYFQTPPDSCASLLIAPSKPRSPFVVLAAARPVALQLLRHTIVALGQ